MPNRSLPHRSSPNQPFTSLAVAAAVLAAGLAACASDAPTAPQASQAPAAASALRAAAAPGRSYFVDPAVGSDGNAGTAAQPFKSLTKALAKATAGDTVRLAKGNYTNTGAAPLSGDVYPLHVPNGVTVRGALQANGQPGSGLSPAASADRTTGLILDGSATVQDVALTVFGDAVRASQGTQTLRHVTFFLNRTGLALTGSANATLVSGAATLVPGGVAVRAADGAQVTLRGDTLSGLSSVCTTGEAAVDLGGASRATVDGLVVAQVPGPALRLRDRSAATAHNLTVSRATPSSCFAAPDAHVVASDSASFTMSGSRLTAAGGINAHGIAWGSRGPLTLGFSRLVGFAAAAVDVGAAAVVGVKGVIFDSVGTGLRVVNHPDATVNVTQSTFVRSGIGVRAAVFRVRNTQFLSNQTGVQIRGSGADLGTLGDPGQNTFVNNANTGLTFENVLGVNVTAAGNTWNPATQGADASGLYPHQVLSPKSANAQGPNFRVVKGTRLVL